VVEVKTRSDQPRSMAERVSKRLDNSGMGKDHMPDEHVQKGSGPTRTHTNIWKAGHKMQNPGLPYRGK
jgi:hypothetical protein